MDSRRRRTDGRRNDCNSFLTNLTQFIVICVRETFFPFFFHCKNLTSSDEGLTLETSAFKLFPVANSVVNT